VPHETTRRLNLRKGSHITGVAVSGRFQSPTVTTIKTVDGMDPEKRSKLPDFLQLTSISPTSQLRLE
jgi:transcription termination factor Rho